MFEKLRNLPKLAAVSACSFILSAQTVSQAKALEPVLIELFTSEGCSSCPPADALLARLKVKYGAKVIILSEHVDYWNYLGWIDPFSSSLFTSRQQDYCQHFGRGSCYTPQMVIDGAEEFNGADENRANSAINRARQLAKISIKPERISDTNKNLRIKIELPDSTLFVGQANLFVATVKHSATVKVTSGENGGRLLNHRAIVQELKLAKEFACKPGAKIEHLITLPQSSVKDKLSFVVFVQMKASKRIVGCAEVE